VHAALIVVLSETGNTARYVAKFRPGKAIVCLTPSAIVARQTGGLLKGVHAYVVDSLKDNIELTRETGQEAVQAGVAKPGDLMVVVSGDLYGAGKNNQIRVEAIGELPAAVVAKPTMKRLLSFVYAHESEN
jgi:pyruvate kinase